MSYYHNRFNEVDRVSIYQFIKHLEELETHGQGAGAPYGWIFRDEFVKLRQIVAFAYSHGLRD